MRKTITKETDEQDKYVKQSVKWVPRVTGRICGISLESGAKQSSKGMMLRQSRHVSNQRKIPQIARETTRGMLITKAVNSETLV